MIGISEVRLKSYWYGFMAHGRLFSVQQRLLHACNFAMVTIGSSAHCNNIEIYNQSCQETLHCHFVETDP